MKKTYIQPNTNVVMMDMAQGILAGSQSVKISDSKVDHFDSNKRDNGSSPIWE